MSLMQIVLVAMRSLKHRKLTALLPSYLSIQTKFSMISGYQFRSITYVLHNSLRKLKSDCFTQAGNEPEEYDEDQDFE